MHGVATPNFELIRAVDSRQIGHIGSDTNPEAAKLLTGLVSEKLGIPKNRVFIQFVDSSPTNFGWQGNTFG